MLSDFYTSHHECQKRRATRWCHLKPFVCCIFCFPVLNPKHSQPSCWVDEPLYVGVYIDPPFWLIYLFNDVELSDDREGKYSHCYYRLNLSSGLCFSQSRMLMMSLSRPWVVFVFRLKSFLSVTDKSCCSFYLTKRSRVSSMFSLQALHALSLWFSLPYIFIFLLLWKLLCASLVLIKLWL